MATVSIQTAPIKELRDCDENWAESVVRVWMAEITWQIHETMKAGREFYKALCNLRSHVPSVVYVTKGDWWEFTFSNLSGTVFKTPKLDGEGETVKLLMPLLGEMVRASKMKKE